MGDEYSSKNDYSILTQRHLPRGKLKKGGWGWGWSVNYFDNWEYSIIF